MTLRIAVLNLQAGIGVTKGYGQYLTSGWKYGLPHSTAPIQAAGRFLKEERIDIALATEVEEHGMRSGFRSQGDLILSNSGLTHHEFFPTRSTPPFIHEGSSVFSKQPLVRVRTHVLPSGRLSRVLGETVLEADGGTIAAFVGHLGLRQEKRQRQIAEIGRIVREEKGPIILGGDFNERDHNAFEIFKESGLAHFCAAPNFPSWKPKYPLAVLCLSSHFTVVKQCVAPALFSDHLPLVVEVEL